MLQKEIENTKVQSETNKWFDDMISNLRVDQLLLDADVLDTSKKELYQAFIKGDNDFMHDYARKNSSAFFIEKLVNSYFIQLGIRKALPKRVALELSNSKVFVWAEIENSDEPTEDALILSAAKVNYDFSEYGFHIASTIVEVDDNLNVPKHYKEVIL